MFYDLKNYHKIRDIKRLVSDDQEKSAIIRLKKIFCTHIKKVGVQYNIGIYKAHDFKYIM